MKPFTAAAVALMAVVSLLQLLRVVLGWQVMLNGSVIPVWFSGLAFVVVGILAFMVWRENWQHRAPF